MEALYRLRSPLTQGGKLLDLDLALGLDSGSIPKRIVQLESAYRATRLALPASVNWFLSKALSRF